MKVVILAGGFGTRISEESYLKPKPMIDIGGKPILWHIMKIYAHYGLDEFIICAGYKQHVIKEWFANYFVYNADVTFDFTGDNKPVVHSNSSERWKVTVVDTGLKTMTGGRIKRIRKYIHDEPFLLTYGDGVSDVDILDTIRFHQSHKKLATMTAIQPQGRFGVLDLDGDKVTAFREKNQVDSGWINGGFFVLEPEVIDLITDDSISFEREPLEKAALLGELMCYRHRGYWQCMDTMRDKEQLEQMLAAGTAPWKKWKD